MATLSTVLETLGGQMLLAPAMLIAFLMWGFYNSYLLRQHIAAYKPVSIPTNPIYVAARDVTLIVPTIGTPNVFIDCLHSWLQNNPLEIIIVTVYQNLNRVQNLLSDAKLTPQEAAKVSVYAIPTSEAGKRSQFRHGILKARGSIIATPDDHILWPSRYLEHMLPAFDDGTIGAVGSPMHIYIPSSRRRPDVITPWEVAAARLEFGRDGYQAMYAAARWCWILTGPCGLWRADILSDKDYLEAYMNDYWRGKYRLDVGDDTFTSRWILAKDLTIAIQAMPETVVLRTAKTTSLFVKQMLRWHRSTIQSYIRTLRDVPQVWNSAYVVRRTLERLLRPIQTFFHVSAWAVSVINYPIFTLLLAAYYIWKQYPSYKAFVDEYPYMRKNLWAAVAVDYSYIIMDMWAWCTLHDTTWEGRTIPQ